MLSPAMALAWSNPVVTVTGTTVSIQGDALSQTVAVFAGSSPSYSDSTSIGGSDYPTPFVFTSAVGTFTAQGNRSYGLSDCMALFGNCNSTFSSVFTVAAPPPPPDPLASMISAADSGFGSTTGFTLTDITSWSSTNLLLLFMGSGLALIYELRYWIAALAVLGAIVYFAYRAMRFFKH